ncbi:hypothetical protein B0T10DRAFT_468750 [Thelonectria olida]|uniref:J domain-containing protein n=1 Tax=Thelonectria olida TaxID=1576542 RepID=A0A9P9AWI9_9HYPO|nr:hypothetical protein B0T10DRAFT_468750 [Thelonectria olida]
MLLHPASLRSPMQRRLRAAIPIKGAQPAVASQALVLLRCREQTRRTLHDEIKRKNHYERLGVRLDATPAEIKKSFYSLSKNHHPDANRSDPNAAHRFSLFSESYTILSDSSRRAAYDRDVLHVHHHHHSAHANPRASYHSSNNPAGGRSPSGLSRRRGTFRGPPPSFYRSGGWGDQGEKRRQAHEESTGTGDASSSTAHPEGDGHAHRPWADPFAYQHHQRHAQTHKHSPRHGGMGVGEDPFGHQEEVPHFDKQGHTRTHTREDRRRWARERRAFGDDNIEFEPQTSIAGHFFIISGILVATLLAPLVYLQVMRLGRKTPKERT